MDQEALPEEGDGMIRGAGFAEDLRSYDAAMRLGWTVYRCDGRMIMTGRAVDTIKMLIERMGERI